MSSAVEISATVQGDGVVIEANAAVYARTYILLCGFALENAMKGLLIAKDPTLIAMGKLAGTMKSHNLTAAASRIGWLVLTEQEERVLQICQDAMPYWGRYSVPLTFAKLAASVAASSEFRESFRALHFGLCRRLFEMIQDGWDSGVGPRHVSVGNALYARIDSGEPRLDVHTP